jgi:hypothetical protein
MTGRSQAIVAVILALAVFGFVLGAPISRVLGMPPEAPETATAWREIIFTLVGALAAYINQGSRSEPHK